MTEKKIKVTCDGTDYVDYKILVPLQGDLKIISDDNLQKLKNSIIKYGFTAPAFIWKSGKKLYSIDCHQRVKALNSLFADGYEIPDIPIVYIKAKDKKEAKEKLLHITSSYGEFTQDGFAAFILDAGLDISDLEIRLANDEMFVNIDLEKIKPPKKELLIPYEKIHILLSFHPDKYIEIKEYVEKITSIDGIEYEQQAN